MTTDARTVARLWVVAVAVAGLVALWVVLARNPFPTAPDNAVQEQPAVPARDPRLVALDARGLRLRQRALAVQAQQRTRFATYRQQLRTRQRRDAAAAAAAARAVAAPAPVAVRVSSAGAAPAPAATTRSS